MVYTSRYSNPELKTGKYTAVRISLGTPKWPIGYNLDAEMKDLMPFGLLGKFERYEDFERAYFERLDQKGVQRIFSQLQRFERLGKDVVLLCYEDIRKGPDDWCHRRTFADWWLKNTGEALPELFDPTPDPSKPRQAVSKRIQETPPTTFHMEQLTLF
jgi:hypothetical protein